MNRIAARLDGAGRLGTVFGVGVVVRCAQSEYTIGVGKGEIVRYKISALCLLLAGLALGQDLQQPVPASGQSALTNDSIIKMLKAGFGEDVIVSMVKAQPAEYSTGVDDLIALKGAGVTDKIITAMVERMASGDAGRVVNPPSSEGNAPVTDVGVYWKKAGAWIDLPPEVVYFKTGGVLWHVGTLGIVKNDINGHINQKHSATQIGSIRDFLHLLVRVQEADAISEYQLLRLHVQGSSREFRTVTGGVFHVSGGATRDLLPFESKKVAPRTYEIMLPQLRPGEYGLFPPPSSDATSSSGRIGKIYSFRIAK